MTRCPLCGAADGGRPVLERDGQPLRRCPGCGVVRRGALPEDPTHYYRDYYHGRQLVWDAITEKRYHAVLQRAESLAGRGRVLDVGCGMGHFLAVAEGRGWEAEGVEVSRSGVEQCDRVRAERGLRFAVHAREVLAAELPEAAFRLVTLFEVLEHLEDPLATLRRVCRLLEPGGLLYLTTPNFDSLSRFALGARWRSLDPEHLHLFNPKVLGRCLDLAGFQALAVVTKNVDVPEILHKWRRPRGAGETRPATQALRQAIEGSPGLQSLRRVANLILKWSRLGETIEAWARKPEATVA